ncbi:MAG: PD40 domain-containing protein [Proteobacteria bacterium]|nr:PD40 domain-containing protein [Pseudomonadota bacterium]
MHQFLRAVTVGGLALVLGSAQAADSAAHAPLLLQNPTLSRTQVAFETGGEIWIAPREGGAARILVSGQGRCGSPIFSPDGQQVAFTATYDGNTDVYVVPAAGGEPLRLTYHPGPDEALAWTPDGRSILFRSMRTTPRDLPQLYTISATGGFPTPLPLPSGAEAAYSPDGQHLAYTPFPQWQPAWKKYRGGQTTRVWIADLADSHVERVPRENSNDRNPIWVGDRVYFLSDRNGPTTLFEYDTKSHAVREVIANGRGPDIGAASAGPDGIVFSQFGSLKIFDPASGQVRAINVSIPGERAQARPHFEKLATQDVLHGAISPTGKRVLLEARGEILSVPAEKGDARNLTQSPGVADRNPAWSPDGKWIAWFSDESGEYALHLRAPDGLGAVRKIPLGQPPSFFYDPRWSPDSKKIAYTDKRLNLWVLDLANPTPVKVDTDRYDTPFYRLDPAWSPDSRWLVYTKQLANHLHAAFVYSLADRQSRQLTDGRSDVLSPRFDRDGKALYFLSGTDNGLGAGWLDMSSLGRATTSAAYVVVLQRDAASPLAPESDEESAKKDEAAGEKAPADKAKGEAAAKAAAIPDVRIDFAGIDQRILALPVPFAHYEALEAGAKGIVYLVAGPVVATDHDMLSYQGPPPVSVSRFDFKTRKLEPFIKAADGGTFSVSADGSKALYGLQKKWFVVAADKEAKDGDGALKLEDVNLRIEPRAEWQQIYREAWRIERDFLYDPHFHGVDLAKAEKAYAPFVAGIASRADLSALLEEMTGHISLGHTFIRGGAMPPQTPVSIGLLGADFRAVDGHVQIARVLAGENWNPDAIAPLTQPGVNVAAGEFLLAVNGRPVDAGGDVYRYFEGLAGKQTVLSVGPSADGKGARNVTVVPVASEQKLRLLSWMEANRRLVDERTGGRVAYVYVPDTAFGGFTNFNRYFYSQVGKEAVIVDERFNHGGDIADFIVEQLKKTPQMANSTREGEDMIEPAQAIFGPKVMLINQMSGSGGDALPWLFRKQKVGTLVGVRTWGGLVGISGYPPLMDGGLITAPRWAIYGTNGAWEVENIGIPPDVEVEQDPALMRGGADPQLDRAIEVIQSQLAQSPPPKLVKPAPPDVKPVIPDFSH